MKKKMPIYRITVDEFLSEDLVRVLFAELKISKTVPGVKARLRGTFQVSLLNTGPRSTESS